MSVLESGSSREYTSSLGVFDDIYTLEESVNVRQKTKDDLTELSEQIRQEPAQHELAPETKELMSLDRAIQIYKWFLQKNSNVIRNKRFGSTISKNSEAREALTRILGIPKDATLRQIRAETRKWQVRNPDGVFGRNTFARWKRLEAQRTKKEAPQEQIDAWKQEINALRQEVNKKLEAVPINKNPCFIRHLSAIRNIDGTALHCIKNNDNPEYAFVGHIDHPTQIQHIWLKKDAHTKTRRFIQLDSQGNILISCRVNARQQLTVEHNPTQSPIAHIRYNPPKNLLPIILA